MLLDLPDLIQKHDLKITGILHVGAHLAEEAPLYNSLGIPNVWWVEGNEDNIRRVRSEVQKYISPSRVIQGLVAEEDGKEVVFHITNNDSMSSSLYEFGTHPTFSPETVFVEHRTMKATTIDALVDLYEIQDVNFLNMDIQGAELLALYGAETFLPQLDYVYTEVNCKQVYIGCAQVGDLDAFLQDRGFLRMETGWVGEQGWGDALYIRKELT